MYLQLMEKYKGWNIYVAGGDGGYPCLVVFPAHLVNDPDNCPASGQWDTVESIKQAIDTGKLTLIEKELN